MGWWLTPVGLGAVAVLVGFMRHPLGWLSWVGLALVLLGIVVGIVRPGDPTDPSLRSIRKRSDGQVSPYFS